MILPRRNIIANLLGSGWPALVQLIFAPVYIHVLGIEAFGLIGVWITMQAMTLVLDLGLGATVNRELARLSAFGRKAQRMRDLVRTIEIIYLPAGLLILAAIAFGAPTLAGRWLDIRDLQPDVVHSSLLMIGVAVALQWPYGLYSAALLGLQRHVPLNLVVGSVGTIRAAGAAAVLWFVSPTLQAFFLVQIAASAAQSVATAWLVWRDLPPTAHSPRFRLRLVATIRRFAAGMVAITVLSAVLTQLDKVVLSGVLPLAHFGYYVLAGMMATILSRVVGPVFAAMYPRLTELVARDDRATLSSVYHRASRLVSVLVVPLTLVLVLFAEDVLLIWTRDATTAARTAPVLVLLLIGTALNGIMHMPYALQLAHGWTGLTLKINLVAAVLLGPLTYLAAVRYGMVGAAWVWVILNGAYFVIGVQLMHRRLLPGEQWRWYFHDILTPLAAGLVVAATARWFINGPLPMPIFVIVLTLVLVLTVSAALLSLVGHGKWRISSA